MMKTTKSSTSAVARMTGETVVWRQSALYRGAAAARRVVCPAPPAINHGVGIGLRHAFRPEGLLGSDGRRNQSQNQI